MSRTVDERVVEMRFDNNQFERAASTTMATLSKLKSSLNLDGATKGLESIDNAARQIDMSGLSSAVDTVKTRFSALEVIAITTLANITNSAVNTGKRLLSALTIAPIKSGFQEYETQINAIQTILANTEHQGTNLQQVNKALDELNLYADKTIYNFTQMTKNIGTFTAAGVDLQTSVDSIKGIANLAAVSGSTATQASTAMYQLSQALAAGRVSLMDWNSVVNAGMGGKVFQDALVRTSELLNTGAEAAIKQYGSFRESLTQGQWLTTQVLTETLKQFAGAYDEADLIAQGFTEEQAKAIAKMAETAENAATKVKTVTQLWDTLQESAQSGWTQTWEILFGDFDEAKELLTSISDIVGGIIQQASNARNEILSGGLSTGWKQLLDQGIDDEAGYIDAIEEVARKSGDAFDKMVEDSDDFSDALKKGLKGGTISAETLEEAVHNLSDKMSKMSKEELDAAGYTSDMVKKMQELDKAIKNGSVSMDDFVDKILKPSGRENIIESLWNAAKGLASVLKPIKEAFQEIFPAITSSGIYKFTEKMRELSQELIIGNETASKIKDTFKGFFSVFDILRQGISVVLKLLSPALSIALDIVDVILSVTAALGRAITRLNEFIKTNRTFKQIAEGVRDAMDKVAVTFNFLKEKAIEKLGNLFDKLSEAMDKAGKSAKAADEKISESVDTIGKKLENSKFVKFLEGVYGVAKKIGEAILKIISAIGLAFTEGISDMDITDFSSLLNTVGIGTIAAGFKKLTDNLSGFFDKRDSIVSTMESVRDCLATYQKQLKSQILLNIAKAMAILAASIVAIGGLSSEDVKSGIAVITSLFADLALFSHFFGKTSLVKGLLEKSVGSVKVIVASISALIGFSAAVLVLSVAMRQLSDLDWGQIIRGVVAIGALLAELSMFSAAMKKQGEGIIKGCGQMILAAAAILTLAGAFKIIATMEWEDLGKGAATMTFAIAAMAVAFKQFSKFDNVSESVGSLITVAIALGLVAGVFKLIATMDWGELGKGAAFMVGAMATLVIGLNSLNTASKTLSTSTKSFKMISSTGKTAAGSLIAAAAALVLVAAAMKIISTIDPDSVALGIVALASAMTILVVGLQNMPDGAKTSGLLVAATALLAIAAALKALSSLSLTEIGIGIGAIAGILMTFVGVGALLSKFVGITPALTAFGKSMLIIGAAVALLGGGLVLLASGITALSVTTAAQVTAFVATIGVVAKAIIGFIPSIVEAVGDGIIKIISKLAESADVIAESLMTIVTSLLEIIGENLPSIVDQLLGFIVSIFKALTARIPEIIDAGVEFVVTLFSSIFDSFSGIETELAEKALKGVGIVALIIGALVAIGPLITSAMAAVAKLALLVGEIGLIFTAFGALSKIPGLMELIEDGGNLLTKIGYAIGDFIGSIIGGFGAGLTSGLPEIGANLSAFMINATPFITGAKNVSGEVFTGAKTLAKAVLAITGADVVNSIASWLTGGNSVEKFAESLVPLGEAMAGFSDAVKGMDAGVATKAAAIAKTLVSLAAAVPKSGGLASLFGGSNDLKAFGSKLESFGASLSAYSKNVQGVDSNKVAEATSCVRSIATLIKNIQSVDASALSNFSLALSKAATVSIKNFISAFDSGKKSASAAVTSMLTTIQEALDSAVEDIREYLSEFDQAGKDVAQGFILGIKSKLNSASSAGWNLGRAALVAAKKALDSHSPSKEFIELGKNIGEGMVIGINNGIVAVTSASAKMSNAAIEVSKQGLESFQTWLEERKYYSEISLKEELAGWEALQKMYVEGSEERIKIDREVYRVQNELVEATYQYSMDWIEKKKNYNDLTLAEELAAYKRVQKRYAQGSAIREKLDLKVYQLEKEIADAQKQYVDDIQSAQEEANQKRIDLEEEYADKVKSINEQLESDIEALNKEYEDAIESRADTLYKSYGLFDEVAERETVAGDTLITNLRDQVDEFTDWQKALSDLSARGVDAEFIKELQEMGVKSTAQIEAMVGMSEDDLNEYVSLWSIKHALARSQAIDELEELHDETQENIQKLRDDAAVQLEEYRVTWQTELDQLNSDTSTNLESLRKTFAEKVGIIKNDTQAEMQEMSETAQKILTDAGWDSTGQQIVQGLIDGVASSKSSFLDEMTSMALASVEAVKTTLDINSPSRVFRELGNYTGLGFIKGLHDYIHGSYEAGSDVANSAKNGLSGVLQAFANIADDVLDTEPVIRPVLDLSDVTAGAGVMNNLLSSGASLRLAGGVASTFGINQGFTQTINVDNDGVISELRSLRGEMNYMVERIEKLQVVMNTGALVGELVDPMDTALGQKAMLKGRGA